MQVVETWHGTLPDKFAIVNDFYGGGNVNQSLDVGREYVLFVVKKWLLEMNIPMTTADSTTTANNWTPWAVKATPISSLRLG